MLGAASKHGSAQSSDTLLNVADESPSVSAARAARAGCEAPACQQRSANQAQGTCCVCDSNHSFAPATATACGGGGWAIRRRASALRQSASRPNRFPTADLGRPMSHFDDVDVARLRRRRTVKWTLYGPDVTAAWVAEMDFDVAPPVRAALLDAVDREDLGYVEADVGALTTACADFVSSHYGWNVPPARIFPVADVSCRRVCGREAPPLLPCLPTDHARSSSFSAGRSLRARRSRASRASKKCGTHRSRGVRNLPQRCADQARRLSGDHAAARTGARGHRSH